MYSFDEMAGIVQESANVAAGIDGGIMRVLGKRYEDVGAKMRDLQRQMKGLRRAGAGDTEAGNLLKTALPSLISLHKTTGTIIKQIESI